MAQDEERAAAIFLSRDGTLLVETASADGDGLGTGGVGDDPAPNSVRTLLCL